MVLVVSVGTFYTCTRDRPVQRSIVLHRRPYIPFLPCKKITIESPEGLLLGREFQPVGEVKGGKGGGVGGGDYKRAETRVGAGEEDGEFEGFVGLKVRDGGGYLLHEQGWCWERRGLTSRRRGGGSVPASWWCADEKVHGGRCIYQVFVSVQQKIDSFTQTHQSSLCTALIRSVILQHIPLPIPLLHPPILFQKVQRLQLLLYKLGPCNRLLHLPLIPQPHILAERGVQAWPEVLVAERVVFA